MKGAIQAIGKRKRAVARIFLMPGSGKMTINGRTFENYFGRAVLKQIVMQSLEASGHEGKVDISVNVDGGGLSGQAGAVRHGISRALVKLDVGNKLPLRAEGLLTRDAREVERKKYGKHKARKRPQFSKR